MLTPLLWAALAKFPGGLQNKLKFIEENLAQALALTLQRLPSFVEQAPQGQELGEGHQPGFLWAPTGSLPPCNFRN